MSFMFHPNPYDDPTAVNSVRIPGFAKNEMIVGSINVAKAIMKKIIETGSRKIGIDGYPGVQFETLIRLLQQHCQYKIRTYYVDTLLFEYDQLKKITQKYFPQDKTMDPPLLFGVRYDKGYDSLQDPQKTDILLGELNASAEYSIVFGRGALSKKLRDVYDLRIWIDISPKQATLNYKNGKEKNLCEEQSLPYAEAMRRNYYLDFECAIENRWSLIKQGKIDLYISANDIDQMSMLSMQAFGTLCDALVHRPLRCKPVYMEGVWGGSYFKRLRNLPDSIKNTAWIFDFIPSEVSLVAEIDELLFEMPFFTFVQMTGETLLGRKAFQQFHGYFPIRFNYDDTYHSSGNMSIQCHPDEDYAVRNHNELGRQDESYYVCATGTDACIYLGFKDDNSCETFIREAEKAQNGGGRVDYKKYINVIPSVPGRQVMIPAGTIHASGRNQVVLEIGSLTVGSYTYKMYDYHRIDPVTNKPRPIHIEMGRQTLRKDRTSQWVKDNLVDHGRVVREGNGVKEQVIGEHELLYFSLRNEYIERSLTDDTNNSFHVLALVDGDRIRVESIDDPTCAYELRHLDIVVVPAIIGKYRIINLSEGPVLVHKTLLKEDLTIEGAR